MHDTALDTTKGGAVTQLPYPGVSTSAPPATESASNTYPVSLEGDLDPGLSRWKWLVKWILAIPHVVVLFALWIGFLGASIAALVMVLATGRYPRSLFNYNLGVLRWTWRVTFYAFNALGTDRYPPMSLGPEPDYPARLTIEYPERLSRPLALFKWWLLAIPHYVLVGIFVGGFLFGPELLPIPLFAAPGSLIWILAVFAGVVLLFTARYPQSLFRLVLGLNRWAFRVVAYAALMRDEYPPFRLER
jgi:hypothetical protein